MYTSLNLGACGSRARNRHIESYLIPPPVSSGGHAKCPSSEKNEKGIVLTDHGQQLFDRSRDAFAIAEEAIATVQNEKVVFSGTVRLSLPPDIATEVLAPALIRFKLRYPEVVVDMTLADRRVSLIEEGYDLAVRMGALSDSELMSKKIASLPRTLVASPKFVCEHPDIASPDDLNGVAAVAIRRDLVEWDLRGSDGNFAKVRPKIGFAANRQTILIDAVRSGFGVANLPTFMVDAELQAGQFVRVLPDWEPTPVEVTALWQRTR